MSFQLVSGWGRAPQARTRLVEVEGVEAARKIISASHADDRGLIVRGLGRSYGDAAQRSGGTTIRVRSGTQTQWLDRANGLVRCPADVSIGQLVEFAADAGYFVPVTPGTRYVSVGGAVAADIHGKDHHVAGSFGSHVTRLWMLLAGGDLVEVTRESDAQLFRATLGGMGLTGVILDADIRMHPVQGHRVVVDTFRTESLDATMAALTDAESKHRYSVAWVDLVTSGQSLGRGVVTNGDHIEVRDDRPVLREPFLGVPPLGPVGLVNRMTVKAFNEVWFRKAPSRGPSDVQDYDQFFYPLDAVRHWNHVYGRRGFLQYQMVLPFEAEDRLASIAESLVRAPAPVALAVLKRFGPEGDGYLSFPKPGWTLTADMPIPASPGDLELSLRSIDEQLVDVGGRVYLAKDSRLGPDVMAAMYPDLDAFRSVRDRVDPNRLFQSDLSARLEL